MSPDAYKAWLASRKVKFIFRTLENCWNRVFVFVFYFCVCFKHSKIVVTKPLVFFSISGSVSNSRKLFESSMCVLHSIFVSVCSLLLFMFWTLKFFFNQVFVFFLDCNILPICLLGISLSFVDALLFLSLFVSPLFVSSFSS
jgi:hypothetical protein